MPTTGSGLFPYPNSSAVPDVPADILLLTQKIDLIASGWTLTADATSRAALVTNSFAYEGLHVYQIDTKALYIYQSSAWVLIPTQPESNVVVPASVSGTGAVLSSGGLITCTATPTLTVTTAFPTTYTDFRLRIKLTAKSATGDLIFRLRQGGSDATTNYTNIRTYGVAPSTNTTDVPATTSFPADVGTGSTRSLSLIEICGPNVAAATMWEARMVGANATARASSGGDHSTTTAYPDFTLTIDGTKTFTGTVQIFGINKSS